MSSKRNRKKNTNKTVGQVPQIMEQETGDSFVPAMQEGTEPGIGAVPAEPGVGTVPAEPGFSTVPAESEIGAVPGTEIKYIVQEREGGPGYDTEELTAEERDLEEGRSGNDETYSDGSYNRSNVNRLKRMILVALLVLFLIPTILCVVLMIKMHSMQNEMDALRDETLSKRQAAKLAVSTENPAERENSALASLEKDKKTNSNVLHQSQPVLPEGIDLSEIVNADMLRTTEEATTEEVSTERTTSVNGDVAPANWNGRKVYLTFDDGPSENSNALMDVLKKKQVKATFFMVLKDTEQSEVLKRMVREGHALGIHSASHVYGEIYADLYSFKKDVETVYDLIYEMTGEDVRLYRFPGGSSNRVSDVDIYECIQYLNDNGYTYFDWNALNEDAEAEYTSPAILNQNVLRYIRNNTGDSVVLMHDLDGHPETLEALPELIDTLKAEGYWLLPIDETTEPVQHRVLYTEEELASMAATGQETTESTESVQ